MDEYSPRQLSALAVTALAAPLVTVCSAVSWQWVLLGAGAAGVFLFYIVWSARGLTPGTGYAHLVRAAYGGAAGTAVTALYWAWLVLLTGLAASMVVVAFPQDRAFPLIPAVLLLLASLVAAKGAGAVCRFGGTLFLAVAALLACNLVFGAGDVRLENLRPAGSSKEALGPLSILLLPAAALFLRDRLAHRGTSYGRWYLLAAGLAVAVSVVCVGALGLPLAKASANPFWLMSRSISILGVMERFEAVISSLLSISFCCLLAFLLSAGQKALQGMTPMLGEGTSVWCTAALGAASMWLVPRVPAWIWCAGNLLFWGILPVVTLAVVRQRKKAK